MPYPIDLSTLSTDEKEILVYIGVHITENYITVIGNWQKYVHMLVISAYEQRGAEFAQKVTDALLRGNSNKSASVRNIAKRAMARVRVNETYRSGRRNYVAPQHDGD